MSRANSTGAGLGPGAEPASRAPTTEPGGLEGLAGLVDVHAGEDLASCCAWLYEHPAVRWVLGGELHPGGEATTRRALDLLDARSGERLLDVACGDGTSALLAAGERGCEAVGVDVAERATAAANAVAQASGVTARFESAEATALPFADAGFDAVLCECALTTFADQERAVSEMRRVLRKGGRLAISDVVADPQRLPARLHGPMATIACVGGALDLRGYEKLLARSELQVLATELHTDDARALADRVSDRLRGARLLGLEGLEGLIEAAAEARQAIEEGSLEYATLVAEA